MIFILFIIILLLILYQIIYKKEDFGMQADKLSIKKNNNYSLIYKNKKNNLYVWEVQPIDNYFPIGQKITNSKYPPIDDDILININKINIRPKDFKLISITDDGYGIWRPICHENYISLSDIFSKHKPSKNRIKLINKKYLKNSKISNINLTYKSDRTKGFNLWNIHDNSYFICTDLNNVKSNKNSKIYSINEKKIDIEKKLLIKKTNNYKKLFSNDKISIWRPIPSKNYHILGDIILPPTINPQNIKVPTVYKKFTKPIIDYHDTPIVNINYKNKTISLWKPRCPNGYGVLGCIFSLNNNEPLSNEIHSIPLEYLKTNKNLKIMYNPIININNKYSIWSNNNFCIAHNDYTKPKMIKYLNYEYCNFEKDILDTKKEIHLLYSSGNDLALTENIINFIRNQLSQRCGVPEYRFNNFSLIDNKIILEIDSKPKNSDEHSIDDIIDTLQYLISKNNLKLNNDEVQIKIVELVTNYSENKDKININNDIFIDKLN